MTESIQVSHEGPWSLEDIRHWIRLLNTLARQRGGLRRAHFFSDLALGILAHHVVEYANAVVLVLESDVPGTAYPLLRAAFEAQIDVLYLTTSGDDFDFQGARAYVAARVADYAFVGLQRRADAIRGVRWSEDSAVPLRELIRADAETWERWAPGTGAMLSAALKAVEGDRGRGRRHWSGVSRADLHRAVEERIGEHGAEAAMRALYDQMSTRSHSGLRLGHYVSAESTGLRLTSKPEIVDPFPLQALGITLNATVASLAKFYVENPVELTTPGTKPSG